MAEAMVDAELAVEGISEAGKVLTFSASEALKYNFSDGTVNSIEDIMELNGIQNYEIARFERGLAEDIIALFLNPAISGILILVILGGIYFELQTPGIGFPLAAAVIATILYFVPYYLNGLAANWELVAFGVGILLIAAEIFVIPGFGVAGISGIIISIGSLGLMMLDNEWLDFTFVGLGQIQEAVTTTLAAAMATIIMMLLGASRLGNSRVLQRVALQGTLSSDLGYTSRLSDKNMVGLTGKAYTVLRPSGKVMIDGQVHDAATRGDYIEKGEEIIVISDQGSGLRVKRLADARENVSQEVI